MKWYSYSIELDKRVRLLPFGRSTSTSASTKKPGKTLKLVSENVDKVALAGCDFETETVMMMLGHSQQA